jgi:hypothetical protein
MLPHSHTLSWFGATQSLLFLLNAAFLVEKQQIPILLSLVWPNLGSNPQSTTLEASTLTITPPMRLTHYWKLSLYQFKSLVILYHFACRFFAFNKLGKNVTLIVSCFQIYFCYIVVVGLWRKLECPDENHWPVTMSLSHVFIFERTYVF